MSARARRAKMTDAAFTEHVIHKLHAIEKCVQATCDGLLAELSDEELQEIVDLSRWDEHPILFATRARQVLHRRSTS